ncbi:MAG: ABC transporter ATP-binding protein [Clostridia bacterium]|nr:ABC transporter ATP-binding protein [Clostridia bacterium]
MAKIENKPRPIGGGPMMAAMNVSKAKNFKKSTLKLIFKLKPFKVSIIISFCLAIVGTVLSIVGPIILNDMMKSIFKFDINVIYTYGVSLLSVYIIAATFSYLQGFIMAKISAKMSQDFREEISKKINRLPLKYFDKNSYGDVLSRITNDVDTIGQTLNNSFSSLISSVIMIIGIPVMMFTISWELTLITLCEIPLAIGLIILIVKFSQKYFKKQQKELGDINGNIEEIYSAHNIVKVFNGEKKALDKFDKMNNKLRGYSQKSQFLSGLMFPIISFVGNLVFTCVVVYGAWIAIQTNNIYFAATIITFITYIRIFNQPIGQLGTISGTLQSTAAASERVFEFLEEQEQEKDGNDLKIIENIKGKVEFRNINFGYEPDKQIINNFDCIAQPGQKIAIVGPTGAGKTTLVNLLMRFYEIDSGEILIDDISTKEMSRDYVRKLFSMVLQDTWLFQGTIMENLKYGNPKATEEEVKEACKVADIDFFIETLPNGYNMMIEGEESLSQGQRQLMTIARSIIQNAPMLILDEATSSVDTRTEVLIQKAMDKLMHGRTSFIIAHRLSTIKNADLILVLEKGNIVEQGTHNELLNKKGFYYDLYNSQFVNAEIEDKKE